MERKRVAGRFVRRSEVTDGMATENGGAVVCRPPRPAQCRHFARKRVAEALPEILDRFVHEAKKGSIAHAKALASLSGLDKADAPTSARTTKRESLSSVLMKQLEEGRERNATDGKDC